MRPLRTSLVVGVLVLLSAPPVSASPASSANSTVPMHITLVGSRAGAPDATGSFTVVVRDLANNPLNHQNVVVDLSGCTDLAICSDQLDPAATVNCAAKTVGKFSDVTGSVSFTLVGASNGTGNATTLLGGARVYANGVLLRLPTASAFDLDGVNGVGIDDLSVWLSDFGAPGNPAFGRSDFDGDGKIDINDLSLWVTAYGAGGSVQGCVATCP
jgi:hypothetical protein